MIEIKINLPSELTSTSAGCFAITDFCDKIGEKLGKGIDPMYTITHSQEGTDAEQDRLTLTITY